MDSSRRQRCRAGPVPVVWVGWQGDSSPLETRRQKKPQDTISLSGGSFRLPLLTRTGRSVGLEASPRTVAAASGLPEPSEPRLGRDPGERRIPPILASKLRAMNGSVFQEDRFICIYRPHGRLCWAIRARVAQTKAAGTRPRRLYQEEQSLCHAHQFASISVYPS